MRWRRGVGKRWVEDRRARGGSAGLPIPLGAAGGAGGLVLLVVIAAVVLLGGGLPGGDGGGSNPGADDRSAQFVGFVAEDVQDAWTQAFAEAGREYEPTRVVLFEQATTTAGCGPASSSTGPFYCPADRKVYLDLGFFQELRDRFGAPGNFAQAYVIAHEYAHHVQNLTGTSDDVRRAQQADPEQANELSIRLELQADCLAGVWGHSAAEEDLLVPGDLERGLAAAAAIGDDRIQRETTGRVDRESWTHGSSQQRVRWFRRGFESGDVQACNTFGEDVL
jgi:predicted metalloprotease